MCRAVATASSFDPMICPLLCDLPPEEQAERMRDDPRIRACISALDKASKGDRGSPKTARKAAAYEALAQDASRRTAICDALPAGGGAA